MPFVADLHVHSRFSRATSRGCTIEGYHKYAQLKGVTLVGTGDFTHPEYLAELREKLVEDEGGLYRLREDLAGEASADVPRSCRAPVRFIPTTEISSIYKLGGRTRKVHNVVVMPDLAAAERLNAALAKVGNLASDGRPILKLDSRDLLEMTLEADERGFLIPAHIWTPHFSVFGASTAFNTIEECYGDLAHHIFAVETGLSSDPPMNRRVSRLDRVTLTSNSDAHSPGKLAREANLFDCELSYGAVREALRTREGFLGTIEFFPEEGKYHLDGHRKCGVRMEPSETAAADGLCPVCGKKVTLGVMHRVSILADRPEGARPDGAPVFESLVPLAEIIGEAARRGPATRGVARVYQRLVEELGGELVVLRSAPVEAIAAASTPLVAEGIRRVRAGEVTLEAGYDGEYGRVRPFTDDDRARLAGN